MEARLALWGGQTLHNGLERIEHANGELEATEIRRRVRDLAEPVDLVRHARRLEQLKVKATLRFDILTNGKGFVASAAERFLKVTSTVEFTGASWKITSSPVMKSVAVSGVASFQLPVAAVVQAVEAVPSQITLSFQVTCTAIAVPVS